MGSELTSSQTCEILQSIDLVRSEVRRLHEMDRLIAAGGNIYEMYSKLYRLVAVRYRLEQPAPETRPVPDDRWIKHSEETPVAHKHEFTVEALGAPAKCWCGVFARDVLNR